MNNDGKNDKAIMPEIENIQEENLENQITNSKEESVSENISQEQPIEITQPETQKSKLQTEEMEVHKHPHHLMHKKKWTEYFLEFLMIFFAVTLGFFAENIREDITDNAKTKEYAKSLYADLRKDSADLNNFLSYKLWKVPKFDSLILLLQSSDIQKNAKLIYYYHGICWINYNVRTNDATIQQLRSSGNLRYFTDIQLYNSITRYYTTLYGLIDQNEKDEASAKVPPVLIAEIFNSNVLASMISVPPDIKDAVAMPENDPQLRTTNPDVLNEYLYDIEVRKVSNDVSLLVLKNTMQQLDAVMQSLQKKYEL
jgi:hypothetical protein